MHTFCKPPVPCTTITILDVQGGDLVIGWCGDTGLVQWCNGPPQVPPEAFAPQARFFFGIHKAAGTASRTQNLAKRQADSRVQSADTASTGTYWYRPQHPTYGIGHTVDAIHGRKYV